MFKTKITFKLKKRHLKKILIHGIIYAPLGIIIPKIIEINIYLVFLGG